MDEHDEYEPEESATIEPITERVRIIGAEPAGVLAGDEEPEEADRAARYLGFAAERPSPPVAEPPLSDLVGAGLPAEPAVEPPAPAEPPVSAEPPAPPVLPHWTDPPTGQVPAVLDRRGDDEESRAWSVLGDTGPVWREHEHEWEETSFEPSMLADDDTRIGVLEETPLEERQPWEFDDLTPGRAGEAEETATIASEDVFGAGAPVAPQEPGTDEAGWWEASAGEATATVAAQPAQPAQPVAPVAPVAESTLADAGPAPAPRGARGRPPVRQRREPPPERPAGRAGRDVPVAIATGVFIAAVALGCFAAGTAATVALATVVVTLAAAEYFAAVRRAGFRPATLLGLVGTVAVMVSAYTKGVAAEPLVLVLVVVTSLVWYLVGAERGSPLEGSAATVFGFAWVGLIGSFAALLLAPSIFPHRHGIAFLLGAVVATVAADVGALAVGSWLGRHQLAPHVSPNKTWEGWIAGAVLSVVASAFITGQVHPWTPSKAAILGAVVAVIAPVGDLCESLVKRELGLKDMGSLLPGHGGVLDRVDGLLFVLPATYYLVRLLNLG